MFDEFVFGPNLSENDGRAFDTFVDDAALAHYSQTRAWAPVGVAGRPMIPWFFLQRRGDVVCAAAVVRRVRGLGPIYLPSASIERGPVVARAAALSDALVSLRRATLRAGILRLSCMPYVHDACIPEAENVLRRQGFRLTQAFDGAHARTLRLRLGEGHPLSKNVSAKARRAAREGATTRVATRADMPTVAHLHGNMMDAQNKSGAALSYFETLWTQILCDGTRGQLFLCEAGGQLLSFAFIAKHGAMATYVMGASSQDYTQYNKMLPAMNAGIAWAEHVGCTWFDLGGIPMDGDEDPKRVSIAAFKRLYVKDHVDLLGEHTRWF